MKRLPALVLAAAAGLVVCIAGFRFEPQPAFGAWLAAWWFWLGLTLGSLSLQLMLRLVHGSWRAAAWPMLAAATRTLPLMALLFLPILGGLPVLYPWALPAQPHGRLGASGYLAIMAACFAVWLWLAHALRTPQPPLGLAAAGALLQLITVTLAAITGVMSLVPEFASTVFGLTATVSQMLGAMALLLFALPAPAQGRRDAAGVLLMLVLGWAYLQYMDYLTAWVGNLPSELAWYLPRVRASWRWLGAAMVLLQAGLPFALLLFPRVREGAGLRALALATLAGNAAEAWWRVRPSQHAAGFSLGIFDPCAFVGIGALWLAVYRLPPRRRRLLAAPADSPMPTGAGDA